LGTAEVRLECSSGSFARATLRIVRPEVGNALSREGAEQLSEAVDLLAADPPGGVVVAAEGERFFCAGGDLEDYRGLTSRESAYSVSMRMQGVLARLRALPCLVVCAIEGAAIVGGAELALACDLRIAGSQATLATPQSRLGVMLGWGGAVWLVEAVGRGRAVELLTTGRTVGAEEAAALGLVHTVVPAGHAEPTARAVIGQAATASPAAVTSPARMTTPSLGSRLTSSGRTATSAAWAWI